MIEFGREICGNPVLAGQREWLVTNGIGGYASGTIAGFVARRYHGLLIAALEPPLGRTLLLTKLDETARYVGRDYPLFANQWESGEIEPTGFDYLERFHLEGTTPVWTFAPADALLEKRVWMQPGTNTTYVCYHLRRATAPLVLRLEALVNYRDHHANTQMGDWSMHVDPVAGGLRLTAFEGARPFYLLSDGARAAPQDEWRQGYFMSVEDHRGLDPLDDNFCAGLFEVALQPGESCTLVASLGPTPNLDGASAYTERREYERGLLARASARAASPAVEHLVLAADQFVVQRALPVSLARGEEISRKTYGIAPSSRLCLHPEAKRGAVGVPGASEPGIAPRTGLGAFSEKAREAQERDGRSVIAGYPWFGDWGRDTMISLPGLTLSTGRPEVAARILRTFAHFVNQGMLPNRFPDEGQVPEYNTVDATLWYFEAIRAYHQATEDDDLLRELLPVLQDIVGWHQRGTRYNIRLDPDDGLIYAGEAGVQLTWMDAKVGDWVVTPRVGKPVEINALWYNALRVMVDFARRLGESAEPYGALADRALAGFARFWSDELGHCYDVLDGPDGDDPALRPNQLFAVSLPHSPLAPHQQRAVVDACARHLLTSHGLRSLAPDHPDYVGHYGGDQRQRDAAYHQGTVWGWLIGPFVIAHLRAYGDPELARSFLLPLSRHLTAHAVGSLSEIFEGDPPFRPRGCFAQAWTVAEMLRAWQAAAE